MIKLTNRQRFNTFWILSNHGNDIKTFKTQVERRAAGKVKNGVRSFCYKSFRYFRYIETHRKIPKISPGAYVFQRPFLRVLYSGGLIYGEKFAF